MEVIPNELVLDTSAYAHLRRNHSEIIDWLAATDVIFLPVVVFGELLGGFRAGSRYDANRRDLAEFLDEPFVELAPATASVADQYGELFAQLRSAGTPIPANDIWIAATALDCGGHLVTFDRDFEHVDDLDVTIFSE